ncbi:hypothetical protein F5Y12DRAFT_753248 [Xylaria sp. FL1777]|nr:hypothetical protein F5Y12DRAFT_753248 [Xylaria sp. FL1777]
MARRFFSTSAAVSAIKRLLGYPIENLDPKWKSAVETYKANGAPKKVGQPVAEVLIFYPEDGSSPVHNSGYNPEDKRDILSAKMRLADGSIAPGTHHIFDDGKGTLKKGEEPE